MNKYYFKHLLRTVKRRCLQPLLITLIFALSFLLVCVTVTANASLKREKEGIRNETYGVSDFTVSTNASSPSRFLFAGDVKEILPDAEVTGSFTMPFLRGGELVFGAAVPFDTADELFSFRFSQYLDVYETDRAHVAFVTADFAAREGLVPGDDLTLEVFGKTVSYEIRGVSDTPFLGDRDVMVDVRSAVELLVSDTTLLAALPPDFAPCGTLYVRIGEGADKAAAEQALTDAFPDCTVYNTDVDTDDMVGPVMTAISTILVLLTVIASFAVVFCCTFCMAKERADDAALFSVAGVSRRVMLFWQMGETAVYALLGGTLGFFLSYPLGIFAFSKIGFRFVSYAPDPLAVTIAALTVLAVSQISPVVFYIRGAEERGRFTLPRIFSFLLPIAFAACFILMLAVKPAKKLVICLVTVVLFALIILLYTPGIFRAFARRLSPKNLCSRGVPGTVGRKNASRVSSLANNARLAVILILILSSAFTAVDLASRVNESGSDCIDAEYAVTGGTARVSERLSDVDEIQGIYGFTTLAGTVNGETCFMWAMSSPDFLGGFFSLPECPSGTDVYVSGTYAGKYGLKEGDRVTMKIGTVEREVTVAKTFKTAIYAFVVDPDAFGVSYTSYLVKGADGVGDKDLYAAVTSALSLETVSVLPAGSILNQYVKNNRIYVFFGQLIALFLTFFSLLGIADNLAESYRSRREELRLLRVAGMSRRQLARVIVSENACTLGFVLLAGILAAAVSLTFLHEGLSSFGIDLFVYYQS